MLLNERDTELEDTFQRIYYVLSWGLWAIQRCKKFFIIFRVVFMALSYIEAISHKLLALL